MKATSTVATVPATTAGKIAQFQELLIKALEAGIVSATQLREMMDQLQQRLPAFSQVNA